jgi:hypothetical protein
MSEPCQNASKTRKMNAGKVIGYEYKCRVDCPICHGTAKVEDCPDCQGCGLKKGGVRCQTCGCYGKVKAQVAA